MLGADGIVAVCAGLGVIATDNRITDPALSAISLTDCLPTGLTGRQMLGSVRIRTNLAGAVVIDAQRVATPRTVGRVIRAKHVTTGPARGGISDADAAVTRCARHEVRIGELIGTDLAG
jgi:hypothetical protein